MKIENETTEPETTPSQPEIPSVPVFPGDRIEKGQDPNIISPKPSRPDWGIEER
jgi:hypothetical protein